MKSKVLLKRVGMGAVIVACAALTTYRYLDDWAPTADSIERLDAEMDAVQWQMKSWNGNGGAPRRYGEGWVSQVWFIKAPAESSDHELAGQVYDVGGYDRLSGNKNDLHMTVDISSAPPSEWRIAKVEIKRVR